MGVTDMMLSIMKVNLVVVVMLTIYRRSPRKTPWVAFTFSV